jgi:Protein of unknown function (DUF3109)
MIAIDEILVADDLVEAQFVCDLQKCKGACCVDGDCGAPLTEEEADTLLRIYNAVRPFLPEEHVTEIENQGAFIFDEEFGLVTPTINGGICVYGVIANDGVVQCGIENAWKAGAITFRKPISCHLFPARITSLEGFELVNYEPREPICSPACKKGEQLKVPVYQFLKEPLIRKYGTEFYEALDAVAQEYKMINKK